MMQSFKHACFALLFFTPFFASHAAAVSIYFTQPASNNIEITLGSSPKFEISRSGSGVIDEVRLYINGDFLRAERVAPYLWPVNNGDAALRNLSSGEYRIQAKAYTAGRMVAQTSRDVLVVDPAAQRSATFTSPAQHPAGTNVKVSLAPSPAQGVSSVSLFINSQLVRIERITPYTWGEQEQNDTILQNMAAGTYQLLAEVLYEDGTKAVATQRLTIASGQSARFTSSDRVNAGSNFQVQLEPQPRADVQQVELFVNGNSLRVERIHPYQWGGSNTADTALSRLAPGQHQLRAATTFSDGRVISTSQNLRVVRAATPTPTRTPAPTATPTRAPTPTPAATPVPNAWSNPATWGGTVPRSGDVTIRRGQKVVLDTNVTLDELTIDGELSCADKNLRLNARIIMVHGRMDCGSESRPYKKSFVITLTGRKPGGIVNNGRGMGTKVLGVMNGGILNFHGEDRDSWLMLNETAAAGSRELVLEQATDWRVGDRLVVTSTSQNMKEAEEVRIAAVNGRIITLSSPLRHRHFGEIQRFSNGSKSWSVDTRAEVGLLSRNIKVVGDGTSEAEKFGGHIMVMRDSEAYISGVQLDRLGQLGLLGRYPFHWHLAGDVSGQYIKNSAIYNSFNRCVTVHGSHNALVDDNVCFKHVGHGYFLEDGVETGNVFNHNLGVWTIKPSAADAIIPSDNQGGLASRGPATFWISNGDNTYTNNAAAGSDGLGFWYDTEDQVSGPSRNMPGGNVNPRRSRFGGFSDNRVHSSHMAFSTCSKSSGVPGYLAPNGTNFKNLTVFYGGNGGVWPCDGNHKFDNLMVTDTGGNLAHRASFVAARPSKVMNSLFVANSKLAGSRPQARAAFGIYDFGVEVTNSHVENYKESSASPVFTEVGGALTFMHQSVKDLSNRNTDYWLRLKDPRANTNNNVSTSASVIRDLDNSLGFGRNMSLTPDLPLMVDGSCRNMPGIDQAKMCPGRFVQVRLNMGITELPGISLGRSDISTQRNLTTAAPQRPFYKVHMPVNRSYRYEVDFKNSFSNGRFRGRNSMSVQADSGNNGDVISISLKKVKSSARIGASGWTQVSSLSALNRQSGNAWFKQGDTLHLRMMCSGNHPLLKARSAVTISF